MAINYILYNDTYSGNRITNDLYNNDYCVSAGATFGSTDGSTFLLKGTYNDVYVRGTVVAATYGISLGDDPANDYGNTVHIAMGGAVMANYGVRIFGQGSVYNAGQIDGNHVGVYLSQGGGNHSSVTNAGVVMSGLYGIYADSYGQSSAQVVNHGTVASDGYGVVMTGASESSSRLTNTGEVSGKYYSVYASSGSDTVINHGHLVGSVTLGYGDDRLDNRGGTLHGTAYGDNGDDRFLPGQGAEEFDGGEGFDTLDFRGSDGVRVSLAADTGNGVAQGDLYTNFEAILGSRGGDDALEGDGLANQLQGFGGRDALSGQGGNDILIGGVGADSLRGGKGDDTFVFATPLQGGDVILDFHKVAGDNDHIEISVAGFGAGLVAGSLPTDMFRSRADNLAQDRNDRFVFRTTDQTLWFDEDGKGGVAGVMIADFQAGVTLAAGDIVLV